MTDEEWRVLVGLLEAEPTIVRARIYGSRQSGKRRPKDLLEPLDIDLAIEVRADDPDDAFTVFFAVAMRLDQNGHAIRIQTEDLMDTNSKWFDDRQAGLLILDRDHRRG